MNTDKKKKNLREKIKRNDNENMEAADFLEYDGPYKDDPFKEKEIIIS